MPIDGPTSTLPLLSLGTLFSLDTLWLIFEVGVLILSVIYFVFSLIVVRQVVLMTESLVTEISPIFRGLSIIHSGLALGVVVYLFWLFFR